jgi:4-hydroxythreonine-4-phosphate dehydrogenase
MTPKNKLGISLGDMNGIGMEILLKAFADDRLFNHCIPVLYATPQIFKHYKKQLELENPWYQIINHTDECVEGKINLKIIPDCEDLNIQEGKATEEAGKVAFLSLQAAVMDIRNGQTDNLLTLPINKHIMPTELFPYAGHTDYLAEELGADSHMMLLVGEELRVGLVTGHVPLSKVSETLDSQSILSKLQLLHNGLKTDFGITKPKIAVLGLNPHSGDNGLIGMEEKEVIVPAIKQAIEKEILAFGPYPSDGFFGKAMYQQFDAVLAMYHDQGLIPFKYAAFDTGVNYTMGLPVIRTSPDHGTAYDIAGKGKASTTSLIEAIFLNNQLYRSRLEYYELTKNPLPYSEFRREKFSIGVPRLDK